MRSWLQDAGPAGSQAGPWPHIAHPAPINHELTRYYLLCLGVLLKALFGGSGNIMNKKIENQPPPFRDAHPPPHVHIAHSAFRQTSHSVAHHLLVDEQDGKIW